MDRWTDGRTTCDSNATTVMYYGGVDEFGEYNIYASQYEAKVYFWYLTSLTLLLFTLLPQILYYIHIECGRA